MVAIMSGTIEESLAPSSKRWPGSGKVEKVEQRNGDQVELSSERSVYYMVPMAQTLLHEINASAA